MATMITCVSCDPLAFPSASSSSSSSSSHLLILLPPPFLSLLLHVFRCKSIYRHFVGDVCGAPFAKILSSTPRSDASFRQSCVQRCIVTTRGNFRLFGQLWIPKYLIHVELEHEQALPRSPAASISDLEN